MLSTEDRQQRSVQRRLEQEMAFSQQHGQSENGISLSPIPSTSLHKWNAQIHFSPDHYSPDSAYTNGTFNFILKISTTEKSYPFLAPEIYCVTKMYSPHIHAETGKVYFSSLSEENWSPILHFRTILLSMVVELLEPKTEYAADEERMLEYLQDEEGFWGRAREWTGLYATAQHNEVSSDVMD
ncbi:putative ubiquitin-conjugating enzyme E2, ubiquitin-conjugating enzyme/RWD [Septoria linicola]|nr:putative ubiquitin-conjugating enzyme E2, ubiquitin-conjugating enzyme/RWD [Septoria linicola]